MAIRTRLAVLVFLIAQLVSVAPAMPDEQVEQVAAGMIVPRGIAYGFDSLWLMSVGKLSRISPKNGSAVDIPVEGAVGNYRGIAVGEGAVWVPDINSKAIYKIDPKENRVVLKIGSTLFDSEASVGVGEGSVWAVIGIKNEILSRYDAQRGVEQAWVALPSRSWCTSAMVAFGFVWVTGTGSNEVYRIDPDTNLITATIPVRRKPRFLASGEGSVWVFNQGDGTVQRIDGTSGRLLATIETGVPVSGGDITVGGGFVWATSRAVPVIKIDPKTNAVVHTSLVRSTVTVGDAIRYGDGSLWISGHRVFRVKPP